MSLLSPPTRRLHPGWRALFILCLLVTLPAWSAPAVTLRLHGSNTVGAALAPALARAWLKHQYGATSIRRIPGARAEESVLIARLPGQQPAIHVEIAAHGSSTAFRDLDAGKTDIGMASRRIKPTEVLRLARLGALRSHGAEHVLGLDGIAVIVHRDNPLHQLSKQQIAAIFAGQVTDWAQVTPPSATTAPGQSAPALHGPIHVYARDHNSGTYDTFKHLVLDKTHPLTPRAHRYESNAKLSDDVARDPLGIGFVGLPYVNRSRALAVSDGATAALMPTEFTVGTEDYALSRRLYLYLPPTSQNALARDFIAFALSRQGQEIVRKVGFISQNIHTVKPVIDADYPAEYRQLTRRAQRLSVNFRFEAGSMALDSRGQRDLERVTRFLSQPAYRHYKLMLFGFSEDAAFPIYNLALSESRADRVAQALGNHGIAVQHVRGYGATAPVASAGNPDSRDRNRRVEVWLVPREHSASVQGQGANDTAGVQPSASTL